MKLPLPLTTERILIREFRVEDRNSYYELMSEKDIQKYLGSPITREKANEQLQQVINQYQQSGLGPLALWELGADKVIGFCGFIKDQSEEGIGIIYGILPQFRRKGYGVEAVTKLISEAFKNCEFDRIIARVDSENVASINLLKKVGMKYFKDTKNLWHDKKDNLFVIEKPYKHT
ncbi:MAG: GNAT family N-acetyltransferase [Candidatus Marinimicrobia bacterium]|nr:GNAT family N-acetyltransferase [Candidatus Neomarinimicrobiota bacterium]